MVALVEYVARRHVIVVQPAPGRLGQHQRVIGDHQIGVARPANAVFHEAALPMAAGGIQAFATPIGQAAQQRRAENLNEPAGQVTAQNIAVAGNTRPARDQAKWNDQ